jgi:hypothetical protein
MCTEFIRFKNWLLTEFYNMICCSYWERPCIGVSCTRRSRTRILGGHGRRGFRLPHSVRYIVYRHLYYILNLLFRNIRNQNIWKLYIKSAKRKHITYRSISECAVKFNVFLLCIYYKDRLTHSINKSLYTPVIRSTIAVQCSQLSRVFNGHQKEAMSAWWTLLLVYFRVESPHFPLWSVEQ